MSSMDPRAGGDAVDGGRDPDANFQLVRLPGIAAAAGRIKAKSFTIDGEAVVLRPDGLSRFDELRRWEAAHNAMLYAFDLIEHNGADLRDHPFLDRKVALARLLRGTMNTSPETALPCSSTLAVLVPRALFQSGWTGPIGLVVRGLGESSQSRQRRSAEGAERELE